MAVARETVAAINLPPAEAIRFLAGKANVTTQHWTDVWRDMHSRAFMVAGAATQEIVQDFRAAVAKALEQGTTLAEFRRDFDGIVSRHGWVHNGTAAWRSRLIYDVNLSMAYGAGRWAQQTNPDVLAAFPYLQYVHSGALHPRKQHQAWDGLVLRADDGFWATHYPPNGWRCGCRARSRSARDLARMGKAAPDAAPRIETRSWTNPRTGVTSQVPEGIDPGFDYNPGQAFAGGRLPEIPGTATLQPPAGWMPPAPALPAPGLAPASSIPRAPAPPPPVAAPPAPPPPVAPPVPFAPRLFRDDAEADRHLSAAYEAWGRALKPAEARALARYKGAAHRPMNRHLRKVEATHDSETLADNRTLSRALRRAEAPDDLVLTRGASGVEWQLWQARRPGQTLRDPGFMSTTAAPDIARSFASASADDGGVVEIRVRRGYKGLAYVHPYPSVDHTEHELLFAPGARFRIISKELGKIIVEAL